jgi:hypothetical protein
MKKNSPSQLGFKVVFLAIALIAVFVFIERLQSQAKKPLGEDNPLALLVGSEIGRPLNWCPQNVTKLQIESNPVETLVESPKIQSYCQLLSESFDSSKIDMQSFRPIMKAFGADGKEIVLEVDASRQVFRYQGLPFGSKQLSRDLEKKFKQ